MDAAAAEQAKMDEIATAVQATLDARSTSTATETDTPLPTATATNTPTAQPTATSSPPATAQPTLTPTPASSPTSDLYATLTVIAVQLTQLAPFLTPEGVAQVATPTPAPATSTPAPAAPPPPTAAPVVQPTPTSAPVAPAANAAPAQAGLLTGFENFGTWRRGDQPYGEFTQSNEQVAEGSFAAKLSYNFPAAAGGQNFVVFLPSRPLAIPNNTTALQLQVYGDGSSAFLNVWVSDAANQTWQFSFGQIKHMGWQPMVASLALGQPWPNGPVGNSTATQMTPPLTLGALVLDGVADGVDSRGVLYLDALAPSTGAVPAAAAPAAAAQAPAAQAPAAQPTTAQEQPAAQQPAAQAPAAQPAPLGAVQGYIAYPMFNGRSMDVYIYSLADGGIARHYPNMRQPDFSRGGIVLLLNGDVGIPDSIVRQSLNGGSTAVTQHPEDSHPVFSPSSESLVYASTHQGDGRWRLYWQEDAKAQSEGTALIFNSREIFGRYPVYLDGWRIAYQGCDTWAGGAKCGIYSADTNGGQPIRATDQTADIPSDNLGSRILFTSNRNGNWDVYIVSVDGGGLTRLTDSPGRDGLATSSPDYQHIAFLSDRDGAWAVWVMNTDGSGQQKLFDINGGYGGGQYEWYEERLSWGP